MYSALLVILTAVSCFADKVVTTENNAGSTVIRFIMDANWVYNPSNTSQQWWYDIESNGLNIPFKTLGVDWNPQGHVGGLSVKDTEYVSHLSGEEAAKFTECHSSWTIPHFDVHFYTWSQAQVQSIADSSSPVVDSAYLPQNYQCPQFGFVPQMGFHCFDVTKDYSTLDFSQNPEIIYGSYAAQVMFLEPMVSVDFLKTVRQNGPKSVNVPQPSSQYPFQPFPKQVRFRYNENKESFVIVLVF